MPNKTLSITLRTAFGIFAVITMSVGLLIIVSSDRNYSDTSLNSFTAMVMAVGLILLPLAIFFVTKSVKSYRQLNSKYGLPDTPMRAFVLMIASFLLIILIIVAIAIYFVSLYSTS